MTPVETPPNAPSPELSGRKARRYDEMEHHELLHLMDEIDDERARARFRESIYISIIVWLILGWFMLYGPRVLFHQGKVISVVDALKQRDKELRYLDLPPDVSKKLPKKPTDIISDKDRVAQTKTPTLDKKTLQQLQAMQRSAPPAPVQAPPAPQPAPQQAAPAPAPAPQQPAPQQAQQQPLPATPLPQRQPPPQQQATLDAPKPNFNTNRASTGFGNLVQQAAQAARSGGGGGNYGQNANPQHPGLQAGAEILSDTMGVDFGPYMRRLRNDIQRNWDPLIPESVRPPILKQGVTGIRFVILPDGRIGNILLETKSGDVALDKAAWGAITAEGQFPPLPKEFKGPYLELRCGFFYNMPVQ